MPNLYITVGVPGSGKSTWLNSQKWTKSCARIGTDFYIEKFARRTKKSLNESFDIFMPRAVRLMVRKVKRARQLKKDIIWEQTSTTALNRLKKLRMLPEYYAIAIVMRCEEEEIFARLNKRTEKKIELETIKMMLDEYEDPKEEEGFKEIWYASSPAPINKT